MLRWIKIECKDGNVRNARVYNSDGSEIGGFYRAEIVLDIKESIPHVQLWGYAGIVNLVTSSAIVHRQPIFVHEKLYKRGFLGRLVVLPEVIYAHYTAMRQYNEKKCCALLCALELGREFMRGKSNAG